MTTLVLPDPPSQNSIWRSVRGKVVRSAAYKAFLEEAGWTIKQQRVAPVRGPVSVSLLVEDKGNRDLDNTTKATLDVLVAHGIIEGDSRPIIRSIFLAWSTEVRGCQITITPAQEAA